ncbi:MAG TPA: hypothetical protein PK685_03855 [archaeon]|nr:hypothetical protein [archaeon]
MKNDKTKLIIWAVVALVIGVIIGMIITNVTTGNAKKIESSNLIGSNPGNADLYDDASHVHYWNCCCNGDDSEGCKPVCLCETTTTGTSVTTKTYYPEK